MMATAEVVWVPSDVLLDGEREGSVLICPVCGQKKVRLRVPIHSEQEVTILRFSHGEDGLVLAHDMIPAGEVELASEGFYARCEACHTAWSDDPFYTTLRLYVSPIVRLGVPREKLHPDVAAKLAPAGLSE